MNEKKKGYAWWIELKCKELEWMNELLLFNWEELKKKILFQKIG